jgi:hypothetical protein
MFGKKVSLEVELVAAAGFEPVTRIDMLCYPRSKMKHEIGGIDYDIYHPSIYRCLHCCVDAKT